jgi:hypothetical protein
LSAIPIPDAFQLAKRKGGYGVAFRRSWGIRAGAIPVWHVPNGSGPYMELQQVIAMAEVGALARNELLRFLSIAPYIDATGDFAGGSQYRFEWDANGDTSAI